MRCRKTRPIALPASVWPFGIDWNAPRVISITCAVLNTVSATTAAVRLSRLICNAGNP